MADCKHVKIDPEVFKRKVFLKYLGWYKDEKSGYTTESHGPLTKKDVELECCRCESHSHIWMCVSCGDMYCLSDLLKHLTRSSKCHLVIDGLDSHIYCHTCRAYVYPREVSGVSSYEDDLTLVAEHWLQILGRALGHQWWRDLPTDAEQKSGKGAGPGHRGLKNFGNTCFMSSTLQLLLHSEPLMTALEEGIELEDDHPIQKQLRMLMNRYHAHGLKPRTIVHKKLFKALQNEALFGQYGYKQMEDAATLLLDVMSGVNDSIITPCFVLPIISIVTCAVCNNETTLGNPDHSLNLALTHDDAKSSKMCTDNDGDELNTLRNEMTLLPVDDDAPPLPLEELLVTHFGPEKLPEYKCEKCSGNESKTRADERVITQASKTLRLDAAKSLPHILIIQLKRFVALSQDVRVKSHQKVTMPLTLDLGGLSSVWRGDTQGEVKYILKGFVCHDGGLGGGHYVALCRNADGEWNWYSDKYFSPVSEEEAMSFEPYLLFYELSK